MSASEGRGLAVGVDDAERAEVEAVVRAQRCRGVEAETELSGDQRVGDGANVLQRVADVMDRGRQDRGGAQAGGAVDLRLVDAVARLEPDAVVVDQAHQGDRHAEQIGRHRGDVIESSVRRRVEDLVAVQRREALRFTCGQGRAHDHARALF